MKMNLKYGIPFIEISIINSNNEITVKNVLIDTGAGSSIVSSDIALEIGLAPSPTDVINRVRGVGGYEYVYEKSIDKIKIEDIEINNFKIEIGDMDYGFNIEAILGTDFLIESRATVDMENLELKFNTDGK
ncbi:retropepsin-like aspartic protease [Clostridium algidicarnis]|uniref:Retroviral-like aspartic protease family protein n=1 Tax=Clostridium algidicarnis TaxID=37659 RepID=A0ABS6C1Z4_9CLOT|nr:retropepsin-like aspartic protease [Clostridium algidicarnis]MBB6631411.1 clan AA aspartic protease [Clostridium algidicarnis]MBU3219501.1 retroviral-like aspartic protease family protein [Clostridium algidicarnis]